MACGGCHIAFDPLNPPDDPEHPAWENISGTVGNQYLRISEMLGSGMPRSSIEWQIVARARPGTVDTSALPNDLVTNPGTMNAIINFGQRPLHEHEVTRWRQAASCPAGADERACWCEPGKAGKCWELRTMSEMVPNILKGGEDSIGFNDAVQRVYFNIGSCSEQCWVNHIPDLRQADPKQRNFGQSPFDIGQCRRDCPNFRAIEDRLDDVVAFLVTGAPERSLRGEGPRLARAISRSQLEQRVRRGRDRSRPRACSPPTAPAAIRAQPGPFDANTDFHATVADDPTLRLDWLGNDEPTPVTEVGTHDARALHSNHMAGPRLGGVRLRDPARRPAVADLDEIRKGGGRGYYRNISLLSVWAHAPFMHNNAIGPELCGGPDDDMYVSPYVGARPASRCRRTGAAVRAVRPERRGPLRAVPGVGRAAAQPATCACPRSPWSSEELILDVAPKMEVAGRELGLSVTIPPEVPQSLARHAALQGPDRRQRAGGDRSRQAARQVPGVARPSQQLDELVAGLTQVRRQVFEDTGDIVRSLQTQLAVHREVLRQQQGAAGERRPYVRRGSLRRRQEGAHRLPGDALRRPGSATTCSASIVAGARSSPARSQPSARC